MDCFYENFIRLCNGIGKTPSAVLTEVGYSKSIVCRWKKGGGVTSKIASKLADYFGVSTEELLCGSPNIDRPTEASIECREAFARNLRKYLNQSQKTQKELAEIVGVSAPTLNDWVSGKKYPRIEKIDLLANYFGISKTDLIEARPAVVAEDNHSIQGRENELLDVIIRFHTDPEFLHTVKKLNSLTPDQFESIKQILRAFSK